MKVFVTLLFCFCVFMTKAQNLNPHPIPCEVLTNPDFSGKELLDIYKESNCFTFDKTQSQLVNIWTHRNINIKASEDIYIDEEIYARAATPLGNNADGIYMHIAPTSHELAWFEPANSPFVVGKFEKLEIGISLSKEIRDRIKDFFDNGQSSTSINPFLEWEIKVVAEFYKGNTLKKTVDGFYYEEFERDATQWNQLGQNYDWEGDIDFNFRVRAALEEIGTDWVCKIKVILPNEILTLREVPFSVVSSNNPGFVKVGNNKRYLTLGGETFFVMGQNFPWPNYSTCEASGNFDSDCQPFIMSDGYCGAELSKPISYINYYDEIESSAENINFIRSMMVPWSWDFEFEEVGNYHDRLHIAWEMDRFFELCHTNDIYVNFSLAWGVQFTNPSGFGYGSWDWFDHPISDIADENEKILDYKAKFQLNNFEEFMLNIPLREYYEQKLRYFIARYGYSTNLSIIEIQNEIDGFDDNKEPYTRAVYEWHSFVSGYLRNTLNVDQLISANYVNRPKSYQTSLGVYYDQTYRLSSIDVASVNLYQGVQTLSDDITGFSFLFNRYYVGEGGNPFTGPGKNTLYNAQFFNLNKPILIAETSDGKYNRCAPTKYNGYEDAVQVAMTGVAGTIVWSKNETYYPLYKSFRDYMNDIDLDGLNFKPFIPGVYKFYSDNILRDMKRNDDKAIFYHLVSDQNKALGVINNTTYNEYTMRDTYYDDNIPGIDSNAVIPNFWLNKGFNCAGLLHNVECDDLRYIKKCNYDSNGEVIDCEWLEDFNEEPFNESETVVHGNGNNKLELHDMGNGTFNFDYYNAFNMNYISSSANGGGKKRIEHPDLNAVNRMVIFKAYKNTGNSFMDAQNETNTAQYDGFVLDNDEEGAVAFKILNNISDVQSLAVLEVVSNNSNPNLQYTIINNLGQVILNASISNQQTSLELLSKGVYHLVVYDEFQNPIFKEKIIKY